MLWRTEKTDLSEEEIEEFIEKHQETTVGELNDLWDYYLGRNPGIVNRSTTDATPRLKSEAESTWPNTSSFSNNNPVNRTPVSYGRKIITTFTGYAYRPRYITYKSENEAYMAQLQETFDLNNEHIKTSRSGRNTGIFGAAYEWVYIEGRPMGETDDVQNMAEPRFINVDPREMILLYDYSPEPVKKIAIRYYMLDENRYHVDVIYPELIRSYERKREKNGGKWKYTLEREWQNFFGEVNVVAYYMGDDMLGIIRPVQALIDDYDILVSDSIVEFDRFANAYLRLVGMNIDSMANNNQRSGLVNYAMQMLKRKRVFENLRSPDDVTFLTKEIPKEFIEFMTGMLRDEIHKQSHIPDFTSEKVGSNLSGVAVQRLMFDFENLVSSAEGDFDLGLTERLHLITKVYELGQRGVVGGPEDITISHKRNVPLNVKEFAETSLLMEQAGFSRWLQADIWPDDVIPDVQEEMDRQREEKEERMALMPDFETVAEDEDNAVQE